MQWRHVRRLTLMPFANRLLEAALIMYDIPSSLPCNFSCVRCLLILTSLELWFL